MSAIILHWHQIPSKPFCVIKNFGIFLFLFAYCTVIVSNDSLICCKKAEKNKKQKEKLKNASMNLKTIFN